MLRFVLVAGLGLAASSCASSAGRLEVNRFQHAEYPYAVFYVPNGGDPVKPLGGDWRVDNYAWQSRSHSYAPKKGPNYEATRRYDADENGDPEVARQEPFYDLLLEHTQKDASMWVRTVPISTTDKDKELAVFAERYVDNVAGSGTVVVRFGAEGALGSVSRHFASRVLHTEPCTVSKREAYRVDFEVANVDQLQLSDQARWERGAVVFVRTGYEHAISSASMKKAFFPVIMAIGISTKPQDFAALEADFETLLKQTVLGDVGQGLSMNGETTCALSAEQPASAGGEAAPAASDAPLNDAAQVPLAPEAMPAEPAPNP